MIILVVKYNCKPGMRDVFLGKIKEQGIDVASRNDQGNIQYDYYLSVEDNDVLLLVEKWNSDTDLIMHSKQTHFMELGDYKAEYVIDTIIERYDE